MALDFTGTPDMDIQNQMITLLDIADAEVNSDRQVYQYFQDLQQSYKKFDGKFAQYLTPKIREIAKRDHLFYIGQHQCKMVAQEITRYWMNSIQG